MRAHTAVAQFQQEAAVGLREGDVLLAFECLDLGFRRRWVQVAAQGGGRDGCGAAVVRPPGR
ncbi:hypothetical protein APASM_4833 [Actinosynnema pretiosum subsp. pretiosum]|nr:hypothetical protein APASM_4833 [Actinosynnema pretiosum subsp. pretiosum]